MKYKVKVDKSLCIGAASCVAVAPDVFELSDEGKAVIKKKDGTTSSDFVAYEDTNGDATLIDHAARSCPVNAIIIMEVDDKGNEKQIWPA